MSKKALLDRNVPGKIFKPKFRRGDPSISYLKKPDNIDYTLSDFSDSNIESSSSFTHSGLSRKFLIFNEISDQTL